MTFQDKLIKTISTTGTKKPDSPSLEILNPLQKNIFVNALDLTPNLDFTEKGKILILINEVPVFSTESVTGDNPFKGFALVSIPLKKQPLRRGKKIQIFIWNDSDSLEIKLTVETIIGETDENLSKGSVPNPRTKIIQVNLTQNINNVGSNATVYTVPTGKSAKTSEILMIIVKFGGGAGNKKLRLRINGVKVINFETDEGAVVGDRKTAPAVGLAAGETITVSRSPATAPDGEVDVSLSVEESVAA